MAGRERGRLFLHRRFCGLCSRFFSRPGKRICFIHAYIITFANRFRFLSNYFAKDDFEDSKKNCWVKIFATRIKKKKKRKEHRKNHKIINIFLLSYSWNFQFNFVIIFIYICPSFISFIFSRFPSLKKKKKRRKNIFWHLKYFYLTDGQTVPTLCELAARCVASHIPFELVEHVYPPVPEQLQLRIAFWSFPDNEEDIRLYSCLANGSAEEFQRGEHFFRLRSVKDPLQIGEWSMNIPWKLYSFRKKNIKSLDLFVRIF